MSDRYMLLDTTTVEGTSILKIAGLHEIVAWGKIYQAQGKTVTAPPIAGRSFAKLDKLQLQYLFWNTFSETPYEDYSALLKECLHRFSLMASDPTPLATLQREVARLYPDGELAGTAQPKEKKTYQPKDQSAAPKVTSTCGFVWEIADKLYTVANADPGRKAVIAACEEEGINPATASTQYGKWKKAKGI